MNNSVSRPRIGIDFHTFDGIFQGSRSHILGIYQEAIALAPEIDFVFLLEDIERLRLEYPMFAAPNVELVSVPHANGIVRLAWQLSRLQRALRLDLLHLQYRLPFFPAGPCACTIHDTLFETHPQFFSRNFVRMARFTGRRAVNDAVLLFTVSEFSRQEIARLYHVDAGSIAVTTNGVDTARFHPGDEGLDYVRAQELEPGRYLCTVGRLEPRKNHVNLLRAYALLPTPRLPLVVVGQRDAGSEPIFTTLKELGLEREVRFLSKVPDLGVPALIRHAAVFVYPSFAEGFGMPVAEAMASGVPVVTSSTTALPEVAGDASLTADPHDPAAIARAITRFLSDPAARRTAAERGLLQAARFNWRAAAEVLVAGYRRYLQVNRPLPAISDPTSTSPSAAG